MELDAIQLGDFRLLQEQIPDNFVDLVFTDPPYPKQYIHCFQYLADYCPRVMKHGASLMTIVGHYELELIMDMFRGKLKYRWITCLNQFSGTHARLSMGMEILWKPMLWYVKGSFPFKGMIRDGIEISGKQGQDKKLHKWQQDTDWAEYYISRLTTENDVVLDPYCGSGTVAEVCKRLNRRFICFDVDENAVHTARNRIAMV